MISRVAESCYWLHRYIERAESTARLLEVNNEEVLDAIVRDEARWKPVVIVTGEQEAFEELMGENAYRDDSATENYLVWGEKNPSSLYSCIYWARENARTIREVISREMWELLNTTYQWLNGKGRREFETDPLKFYKSIRSMCHEFQGLSFNTLSHGEAFDFMRMGLLLERISHTARVMDVKHHWQSQGRPLSELQGPEEAGQWVSLLKFCSAMEPFYKQHVAVPNGRDVVLFLLKDPLFPRSVLHCLLRVQRFFERLEAHTERKSKTEGHLLTSKLIEELRSRSTADILEQGVHQELTHLIDTAADIGNHFQDEFFAFREET